MKTYWKIALVVVAGVAVGAAAGKLSQVNPLGAAVWFGLTLVLVSAAGRIALWHAKRGAQ